MTLSDLTDTQQELHEIDDARTYALIRWLIRSAELTFSRFGGDDDDEYFVNQPLKQAFQQASADLTGLLLEQDLSCTPVYGGKIIRDLASAIAVRLGEEPATHWERDTLTTLAGHIK